MYFKKLVSAISFWLIIKYKCNREKNVVSLKQILSLEYVVASVILNSISVNQLASDHQLRRCNGTLNLDISYIEMKRNIPC